jgi:hypothetical protein
VIVVASTLEIGLAVGIVVVLGLLAAPAMRIAGRTAERTTPLGSRVPEPPEMRRPPEESGPR